MEIMDEAATSTPDADAAAPPGKLLGRAQAARLLGVSKSTLRRMEGQALTPVVGPKNVRLFHEEQIQSMIITRRSEVGASTRASGEVAAGVFALCDENVHPVDVVKQLRLEPDLVEALHTRWCRLRGLLVITETGTTTLSRILGQEEGAPRPKTEAELIAMTRKWAQEESLRRCDQCRTDDAAFCRACAKKWGLRVARNEITVAHARRL
jgi:DNA-binding transcriptional MerR regulator